MDLKSIRTVAEQGIPQFKVKTQATEMPVTLDEAKTWLRRTGTTSEDTLIIKLIKAAASHCENIIGRSIMERVCLYYVPEPESIIYLPFTASEIVSVKDEDNNAVQFTAKGLNNKYLVLSDAANVKDITVEYKSGSTTAAEIEPGIIEAIEKLVVELYENRGDSSTIDASSVGGPTRVTVAKLLYPYRRNILL